MVPSLEVSSGQNLKIFEIPHRQRSEARVMLEFFAYERQREYLPPWWEFRALR